MRRLSRKSFQNIQIKKYVQTPSGRILKNKYIVYDAGTISKTDKNQSFNTHEAAQQYIRGLK